MDQIPVVHQFADQGIDLAQTEGGLRSTLEVAAHETIFVHAHLEGCRASFIDGSGAILFCERENAQDAPHAHFALLAIDKVAEYTDMRAHSAEQLHHTERQVAVMFAEEKPTLLPLPVEPFRYYQYGERVVHLDGCVEVEAAYYVWWFRF